jgi:hypothetical protein
MVNHGILFVFRSEHFFMRSSTGAHVPVARLLDDVMNARCLLACGEVKGDSFRKFLFMAVYKSALHGAKR